ncbi:MAG: PTS sugar transporter subunit IIA [Spirochaetaceae bacterium]|jgi:PTS system nitrogen regulatory IIA component|nr:PTS sugar transporter subunit IIA [Spirochaetaceae bacterium]
MSLNSILSKETISLHLHGTKKEAIINELLDLLVSTGKIQDRASALSAIMDRENKMSTGMKHSIAIPHGKTNTVSDLVACIGISDTAVDFDSLDGEPCRIFIMTLSPLEKTGPHLQFLAEISLLFKSPEKRTEMLKATSADEIMKILAV